MSAWVGCGASWKVASSLLSAQSETPAFRAQCSGRLRLGPRNTRTEIGRLSRQECRHDAQAGRASEPGGDGQLDTTRQLTSTVSADLVPPSITSTHWLAVLLLPIALLWRSLSGRVVRLPFSIASFAPFRNELSAEQLAALEAYPNHGVTEVPVTFVPGAALSGLTARVLACGMLWHGRCATRAAAEHSLPDRGCISAQDPPVRRPRSRPASLEALYVAPRLLGDSDDTLLDGYHWREQFSAQQALAHLP